MNNIFTFILIITFCMLGCEKYQKEVDIKSEVNIIRGCSFNISQGNTSIISANTSCVQFNYDSSSKQLILKHLNAGFNCCPGDISCETQLDGNLIIVKEKQEISGCHCLCLYDLEIRLANIEQKEFRIQFVEPYASTDEEMGFTINLKTDTLGRFCSTRNRYPWVL